MRPPNILVFFTDQQRPDTCGCYGQRLPITPNLDAMAAEGVRFAAAFTPQPVCGPCRSALISGRYPTTTACYMNDRALPTDCRTLAHELAAVGYRPGYLGKWHLASDAEHNYQTTPVPPERRGGFDDYWLAADVLEFTSHAYDGCMFDAAGQRREFPPGRYRVDAQTDWLCEYLQNRDRAQPWFCICSYLEPHHQNDHERYEGPRGSAKRWADFDAPGDLPPGVGDWQREYPDYLGCCHALDQALGRVRRTLQETGQADNTIFIFVSDHGCHFKTRNTEYKRSCHDSSIHVPLVIHGPGFTGGQVHQPPVSLIDLPATILACAGAPVPADWHGRPLQEQLAGRAPARASFVQISEMSIARALRDERYTYCVTSPDQSQWPDQPPASPVYIESHLYDNYQDPHQQQNLIAEPAYADLRTELAQRLLARIQEVEGHQPQIEPAGLQTQ